MTVEKVVYWQANKAVYSHITNGAILWHMAHDIAKMLTRNKQLFTTY